MKNECGWTSRQTMNGTDFNPTIKEMNDSPGYFQYMKPDVSMDSDEPKVSGQFMQNFTSHTQ